MSVNQASTTISPTRLQLGGRVYADGAVAVIEQANELFGFRPQLHVSCACGNKHWATGASEFGALWLEFGLVADGSVERLRFQIYIAAEAQEITVGARCSFVAAETGNVTVTIGTAGPVTIGFANADNANEKTDTVTTFSAGTGWQTVTVELERTAGTGEAFLRNFRIQDEPVSGSFPSPTNE